MKASKTEAVRVIIYLSCIHKNCNCMCTVVCLFLHVSYIYVCVSPCVPIIYVVIEHYIIKRWFCRLKAIQR